MRKEYGPDRAAQAATVVVLALALIGVAILLFVGRPHSVKIAVNTPRPTRTLLPTSTPSPVTVYVSGAVASPNQAHSLPPGSRVDAAVAAAGGALLSADLSGVNMADILQDGAQIHVPFAGQPTAALPTPIGGIKVNINTATVDELDTLPGIGPALAQRIVDYRTQHGLFVSLDDLDGIDGIGPALLEDIRERVRFE